MYDERVDADGGQTARRYDTKCALETGARRGVPRRVWRLCLGPRGCAGSRHGVWSRCARPAAGVGCVPTTRTVHDRTPPGRIARAPVHGDAAIR